MVRPVGSSKTLGDVYSSRELLRMNAFLSWLTISCFWQLNIEGDMRIGKNVLCILLLAVIVVS